MTHPSPPPSSHPSFPSSHPAPFTHPAARPARPAKASRLPEALRQLIDEHMAQAEPRYRRYWAYFANPMLARSHAQTDPGADRPYRQAQEWGLPARITGLKADTNPALPGQPIQAHRKEIVIENDIAWRIQSQLDALLGSNVVIQPPHPRASQTVASAEPAAATTSASASDQDLSPPASPGSSAAAFAATFATELFAQHGGSAFFQHLALLASVHGHVDVLIKPNAQAIKALRASGQLPAAPLSANSSISPSLLTQLAACIRLDVIDAPRALASLSPTDWRQIDFFAVVSAPSTPTPSTAAAQSSTPTASLPSRGSWFSSLIGSVSQKVAASLQSSAQSHSNTPYHVELHTADRWEIYQGTQLVSHGPNALGRIPLVHMQNLPLPMSYTGQGDVEPLIPLQDELNTRLSDRARRLAMHSFKMYLGKGIDGFDQMAVSPGQLWVTENPEASIQEFGGDAAAPSEEAHIADVRQALDKTSSVSPVSSGALRDRLGNLTSAAALRVTLQALVSKTHRKRVTFEAAIGQIVFTALQWLAVLNVLHTAPDQRRIDVRWPPVLPEDEAERLSNEAERLRLAESKHRLGVPTPRLLAELGY